jgi:hypothetical protein
MKDVTANTLLHFWEGVSLVSRQHWGIVLRNEWACIGQYGIFSGQVVQEVVYLKSYHAIPAM